MSRVVIAAVIAMFTRDEVLGQVQPTPIGFDVASVKVVREASPGGYHHQITADSLKMQGVSMGYCIRLAYDLSVQRPYELVGPDWINPPTDVLYDIAAKAAGPVSSDQIKLMLQKLLAERWRLAVHRETRTLSAYVLLQDRNPHLRRSDASSLTKVKPGAKPYELLFEHVSMAQLAQQLGPPMTSRPVIDKTKLTGNFDFNLDLGRYILDPTSGIAIVDGNGMVDTEGATLRAVRDQLGLILRPEKAPISVLVIDHVEKFPSIN